MDPADRLHRALDARADLLEALGDDTDAVRLLHGAVEDWPGTTVDRYGPILLIQTWRDPVDAHTLDALQRAASDRLGVELVACHNHRGKPKGSDFADVHDPSLPDDPVCVEHGLRFDASPRHRGIDPLLFLDFRVARRRIRAASEGATVLNTFAYTCGIGVAALAGGATEAVNLDFAASALEVGRANAARNGLTDGFVCLQEDYFPAARQLAGLDVGGRRGKRPRFTRLEPRAFDRVVLDPPRWAKTRWGAVDVVRDYPSLLKPAIGATAEGGALLATNNHAGVPLDDWLEVVRRTVDKTGRTLRDLEVLVPDADFPSFDGKPPLKLAWLEL